VELAAAQKQERLESELHSHKTNLIKESIRLGHNDLGDFFYNRGDLQVRVLCTVTDLLLLVLLQQVAVCAAIVLEHTVEHSVLDEFCHPKHTMTNNV
jgi:hypothetical protein